MTSKRQSQCLPSTSVVTGNNNDKLSQYFTKAFDRRKRQSVDINRKLLATGQVHYDNHMRAVTTNNTGQRIRINTLNNRRGTHQVLHSNLMKLPPEVHEQLQKKQDKIEQQLQNRRESRQQSKVQSFIQGSYMEGSVLDSMERELPNYLPETYYFEAPQQ